MWCRSLFAASLAALVLATSPLAADELDDFNAAVEQFSAHHRATLHYLRTENFEFAVIELDRLREAWAEVVERFGSRRPAAITDAPLYTLTLTDISTRMIGVRLVMDLGRPDVAGETLGEIRGVLARLREKSGIIVLADCVLAANAAMDALIAQRDADLADAGSDVLAKAGRYADQLKRCDEIASPPQRRAPEFRRLIDDASASLALVSQAVEQRDSALLGRLIDELRAFDRLLAFRFG